MKIVFLDMDGVVNNWSTFKTRSFYEAIEPEKVRLLNPLIERTQAQIVMSSTWRVSKSAEWLGRELHRHGLKDPQWVIGATPILNGLPRGQEIALWCERHKVRHNDIVILDDTSDMAHLRHRLVQTSMDTGLLNTHVERAVKMLGGN